MARPKSDPIKRFLAKVQKVESGCHEWTSTLNRGGYGKFYFEKEQAVAHRVSYLLFVGPTNGKWVLHKCDNRKCVNPDHLFLGDSLDNIQDMDSKNRRGSICKVTAEQVKEIRQMLDDRYSQQYIADKFSISQGAVSRIKRNVTRIFKH
jgi:hypothetical protein